MSTTYDLYYDPRTPNNPWGVAPNGIRGYGISVVQHITDNGMEFTGLETDDEIRQMATELHEPGLFPPVNEYLITGNLDDEGEHSFSREEQIEAVSTMWRFCRNLAREAAA